jgi:hypothetical protein
VKFYETWKTISPVTVNMNCRFHETTELAEEGAEKNAEELYSGHEFLDLLEILSGLCVLSLRSLRLNGITK